MPATGSAPIAFYSYNVQLFQHKLLQIIRPHLSEEAAQWLFQIATHLQAGKPAVLPVAFAQVPRKTGKALVVLSREQQLELSTVRKNFALRQCAIDQWCRVWLLLQPDASDRQQYLQQIESLFAGADLNELVALYTALPLLAYPEDWRQRCTEGIRSNMGPVLQSILCNNPYPAEQLPEAAWNQLVLKAFFTEKPVQEIVGFDERANPELALILADYAQERWAAGRPVNPLLWRGVGPFINAGLFAGVLRAAQSENTAEREAALLACARSGYEPAQALLQQFPAIKSNIESGVLTWNRIAETTTHYS